MNEKYKFNRQKVDFILTDLLPYEKGNHYTHRFFYEYLLNNKKGIKKLLKRIIALDKYYNSHWHSSPLKFLISKKGEGFREISLINPLGLIESLTFIQIFENDIINITHNKNDFSSRKAYRSNSLTYKNKNKQIVYYSDDPSTKKQLLISMESKGTYFNHYPSKTITEFLNSQNFIDSLDKFKYLLIVDIQDCFPSIYTHSYKWLITNKVYDSKNLASANSIYSNIDVFLQNLNGSKTNGIIVGPEISRLLAEFLFVHIDESLIHILEDKKLYINHDYKIYRFVDDYYIFTSKEEIQNIIKNEISNLINKFQLKINESKVSKYKKEEIQNQWYLDVLDIIPLIDRLFNNNTEFNNELNLLLEFDKEKNIFSQSILEAASAIINNVKNSGSFTKKQNNKRRVKYSELRSKVNSIIKSSNDNSLISSYILSAILKIVEEEKKSINNKDINKLITFIFFIYSKKVSYTSTQKIIRTLSLLIEKEKVSLELIEKNIEKFQNDIFTRYPNDWIDLLLFFASYQINISSNLIDKITETIIQNENPVTLASLCIFTESNYAKSTSIVRKVNLIIKSKIENINWEDFFQDNLS